MQLMYAVSMPKALVLILVSFFETFFNGGQLTHHHALQWKTCFIVFTFACVDVIRHLKGKNVLFNCNFAKRILSLFMSRLFNCLQTCTGENTDIVRINGKTIVVELGIHFLHFLQFRRN
ncbi:CLUMA_CG012241, isoform A [Clunio marinus]|uniref:CLUMA_CG012241, isoform A n=1 Tax=Clunio marinus TaxID=568069 RepID=A0A1J1IHP9_9DIPT|nr:CLUMA_CG012241, isoform A [Clunio marinus]